MGAQVALTGLAETRDLVKVKLGGGGGSITFNVTVWLKYKSAQDRAPKPPSPAAAVLETAGINNPVAGLVICLLQIWPLD
jgi:hypothetical protein